MNKLLVSAAAVAASVATLGTVSAYADCNPYVAAAIGQSHYTVDLPGAKNSDTAGTVALGCKITDNVGAELGYSDYGKLNTSVGTGKVNSVQLSALLGGPINHDWSIYGRLGIASTRRDAPTGFGIGWDNRKTELLYGVGSSYAFSKAVSGTLEWHKLNDTDVWAWLVGLRIGF